MNTRRRIVRKQPRAKTDARVERTKLALGTALVDLMHERDFETITVQQVLDRAGVGRATFYSHFRNKRDLFLSGYERMLDRLEAHLLIQSGGYASRRSPSSLVTWVTCARSSKRCGPPASWISCGTSARRALRR